MSDRRLSQDFSDEYFIVINTLTNTISNSNTDPKTHAPNIPSTCLGAAAYTCNCTHTMTLILLLILIADTYCNISTATIYKCSATYHQLSQRNIINSLKLFYKLF